MMTSVLTAEPDLLDEEYANLAHTRRLLRRIQAFGERAAEAADLRPRQYQLLLMLRGLATDRDASVSDLADWLQVRHQTAVGLVDRMAGRGLVERRPDPDDGRRVLVTLTNDGRLALRELARQHRDELRSLAPSLVDALRHVLEPTRALAARDSVFDGLAARRAQPAP
jgi:DNA-binding MarR family transcriptional regulator